MNMGESSALTEGLRSKRQLLPLSRRQLPSTLYTPVCIPPHWRSYLVLLELALHNRGYIAFVVENYYDAHFPCYRSERYRIQCDAFEGMWLVLQELLRRLEAHFKKVRVREGKRHSLGSHSAHTRLTLGPHSARLRSTVDSHSALLSQWEQQFICRT